MELISQPLAQPPGGLIQVRVPAERRTLAKTRWRALAEDGTEFGFELREPLHDGAAVLVKAGQIYVIAQRPEALFRVAVADVAQAATVAWMIGNLHFPAQVDGGSILVEADEAIRQMLGREAIPFTDLTAVFRPLRAHSAHHH